MTSDIRGYQNGPLGILQLQNKPSMFPGAINNPETFSFPVLCRQVPGAWAPNVVSGDVNMEAAFISSAEALVALGAVAITTNCGFAIRFQLSIARAVTVPVATSSLLLLPYLASATRGRIGILTFDSRPLTPDLLHLAGLPDSAPVAVGGLEGTGTWEGMLRPENDWSIEQMTEDLLSVIQKMRRRYDDIGVLLMECAGFPPASHLIRKRTGLPVYDAVVNAKLLMGGGW